MIKLELPDEEIPVIDYGDGDIRAIAVFHPVRNPAMDSKAYDIQEEIKSQTGLDEPNLISTYALLATYLKGFKWQWNGDEPRKVTFLQEWWEYDQQDGLQIGERYLAFRELPNSMVNSLNNAEDKAHEIWKPDRERTMSKRDSKDPNSQNAKKNS